MSRVCGAEAGCLKVLCHCGQALLAALADILGGVSQHGSRGLARPPAPSLVVQSCCKDLAQIFRSIE